MKPDTIKLLEVFAFDNCDDLFWRCDKEYAPITIFVECNDLFFWACADCEEIESDQEVEDLRQAFTDAEKAYEHGGAYAPLLWVARKRKMRPQDPYYKYFNEALHPLFNACGPERPKDEQG